MPKPDPNPNPNSYPDPNPKAPEILLVNPASARYVGGHFNRGGKEPRILQPELQPRESIAKA